MNNVPDVRRTVLNDAPLQPDGSFVLYWMTAYRRTERNYSLQRAAELAESLNRPVLIFEALKSDYPWASDRLHRFVLEGMQANDAACRKAGVTYFPWLETYSGQGAGLMRELASAACAVVTDDFPCFFLPAMIRAFAARCPVKMEMVDSNGLLPLRSADREFPTAYAFRRFLQKTLTPWLQEFPQADVLKRVSRCGKAVIPPSIHSSWPAASGQLLEADELVLKELPIDHSVRPAIMKGGAPAAKQRLTDFLGDGLSRYAGERSQPDSDAASGLSPYLHFGHISAHEIVEQLMQSENWAVSSLGDVRETRGGRSGWWGMSESAEAFLDELITWRELGFNMSSRRDDYHRWESLPDWARKTLDEHRDDRRPYLYSKEEFESAGTHDEVWNAAQRQLVREGRMHNYLRMLWGKKVLHWTETPEQALEILIDLNNRYAVDGRNPNSYSGIFWVFGRYDRAWGPERDVFGKIRYMTSDSTRRKLRLKTYLETYGEATPGPRLF